MVNHIGICIFAVSCALVATEPFISTSIENYSTTAEEEGDSIHQDNLTPSKPRNLSVLEFNSNGIRLSWIEPEQRNGHIDGYFVYYTTSIYTDVRTVEAPPTGEYIEFTLNDLEPDTVYIIYVKAFNSQNMSEASDSVVSKTDIGGPTAPRDVNVTCQTGSTIHIQWERPLHFFHTIDFYYVFIYLVEEEEDVSYKNYTLPSSRQYIELMHSVTNVPANRTYKVAVTAATRSLFTCRERRGQISEARKVYVNSHCDTDQQYYVENSTVDYNDQGRLIYTQPYASTLIKKYSNIIGEEEHRSACGTELECLLGEKIFDCYDKRNLIPSKPRNLSVLEVNSNDILLSWIVPDQTNGYIDGYFVYYTTSNYSNFRAFKSSPMESYLEYTLDHLDPDREYTIYVKAFSFGKESEASDSVVSKTDITGPTAPQNLHVTCQVGNTIRIQWERPQHFSYTIDYYYVDIYLVEEEEDILNKNYSSPSSRQYIEIIHLVTNVPTNKTYKVQVTAALYSQLTGQARKGQISEARKVYVNSTCDTDQQAKYSTVDYTNNQDRMVKSYDLILSKPPKLPVLEVNSNDTCLSWNKHLNVTCLVLAPLFSFLLFLSCLVLLYLLYCLRKTRPREQSVKTLSKQEQEVLINICESENSEFLA